MTAFPRGADTDGSYRLADESDEAGDSFYVPKGASNNGIDFPVDDGSSYEGRLADIQAAKDAGLVRFEYDGIA